MKKRPAILKRPVADVGDSNRPAAPKKCQKMQSTTPCRVRCKAADQTWHYSVPGAEQPNWAQHFVDAVIDPIRNLKEKVGEELRLVLWSDCVGKCTEGTAGELVADVLMKTAGIKFTMRLLSSLIPSKQTSKIN